MSQSRLTLQLKHYGLTSRQLNILFSGLFGFPVLMGLALALQAYGISSLWQADTPAELSAPITSEPRQSFEAMLNPSWAAPRDFTGFASENLFEERFTDLVPPVAALLDLPELDQSFQQGDEPLSQVSYEKFAGEMNLSASEDTKNFALSAPAALGERVNGRVQVLDAGLLAVGASRVRLAGLILPETGRTCTLISGEKADCRKAATDQLGFYLRFRMITCAVEAQNADNEALVSCQVGTSDIGEWLVRRGWALPEASTQQRYRAAALFAQSYQLGQWHL